MKRLHRNLLAAGAIVAAVVGAFTWRECRLASDDEATVRAIESGDLDAIAKAIEPFAQP